MTESDVWSDWLLHHRQGDDAAYAEVVRGVVRGYADRLLDAVPLSPGMTLADIGTGEGLIAMRAIERVGPTLRCLLTDVSRPMLRHAEQQATRLGVDSQCTFIECPADALVGIRDGSVDVVATRAVLAYVADKPQALREFHRILKPGGRISLCEPVLQDEAFYVRALRQRIDAAGDQPVDRFLRLLHRWKAAQFPDTAEAVAASPLVNYSERDLLNLVQAAGFGAIHLRLEIDVTPSLITSWEVFIASSPHPLAPSLKVILAERFTAEERQFFEQVVRPTIESGKSVTTDRVVYVTAQRG